MVGTNHSFDPYCFPEYEEGCRAWFDRQQQQQQQQQQRYDDDVFDLDQQQRRLAVSQQKMAIKMSKRAINNQKMVHASAAELLELRKAERQKAKRGSSDGVSFFPLKSAEDKQAQMQNMQASMDQAADGPGSQRSGSVQPPQKKQPKPRPPRVSDAAVNSEFRAFRARMGGGAPRPPPSPIADKRAPPASVARLNDALAADLPALVPPSSQGMQRPRVAPPGAGRVDVLPVPQSTGPDHQALRTFKQNGEANGPEVTAVAGALAPISSNVSFNAHAICKRSKSIYIRLVHIPKAGGMSLCCTYNANVQAKKGGRTYGDENGCGRVAAADVPVSLQGQNHETYFELVKEKRCSHNIYLRGGSNCAVTSRCEPMVVMMAHPTDRFFAAFFQKFGQKDMRGNRCGFLNCRPGSELSSRYTGRSISPAGFALWENKDDFKAGFNEATKFFGLDGLFHFPKHPVPREVLLRDDHDGRAALRTAKKRLENMDFVGLTSRFVESMELLSWTLGIPVNQFCSCNINAFKSPKFGQHASEMSEDAKAAILSDNSLDKELYDYAVEIFDKRYAAFTAALGKKDRDNHAYDCDTKAMLCKADKGGWVPAQQYKDDNERAIYNGKHSYCAFKCQRKGFVPPTSMMGMSALFGNGSKFGISAGKSSSPSRFAMGNNRGKSMAYANLKSSTPGAGNRNRKGMGKGGQFKGKQGLKVERAIQLAKRQQNAISAATASKQRKKSASTSTKGGRNSPRGSQLPEPQKARGWF